MKGLKYKLKYVLSFLLFVLVFMGATPERVDATSLTKWGGAEVVDDDTVIDEGFTFIPKFTSRTTLTTSGGTWRTTNWSSADSRKFSTFNIFEGSNASRKGKDNVFATYSNVGKYNGQELDLRITVRDWKINPKQNKGGNISFEKNKIAMSTTGFDWVYMDWQFVKAGTTTPVQVKGYFTISDIDLRQGIDMHNTTMKAIDKLYVGYDNQLWYRKLTDPWHRISTYFNQDTDDNVYDSKYAFTYTFTHNRMYFRWFTDWAARGNDPRYISKNNAGGEYFIYTDVKPARFDVIPRKTVSHTNMEHPKNTGERIDYNINFKIPKESTGVNGTYYKSFTFTDTIDSLLDIGDISFYDNDTGQQIASNYFDVKKTGNKVTITASDWRLRQDHFYDKNYQLRIRATVDTNKLEKLYKDRATDTYNVTNQGFLTINGRQTSTNKVMTIIKKGSIPVDPSLRLQVFHKVDGTGTTLASSSTIRSKGYWYNESAKTNLTNASGNRYEFTRATPSNKRNQTGTMNSNTTLTFYYKVAGGPPTPHPDPDPDPDPDEPIYYQLRVEHIDEYTGGLITSSSSTMEEGDSYSASARSDLRKGSNPYIFVRGAPTNSSTQYGVMDGNKTVRFYYKAQYSLTVRHIDEQTGRVITSSSSKFLEGHRYNEYSRSDLKDGIYNYKQLSPYSESGTLTSDTVINFYYRVPELNIDNNGIHIFTDLADRDQPADIFVNSSIKPSRLGKGPSDTISEFSGGRVRLLVRDTSNGKVVYSKERDASDIFSNSMYDIYLANQYLNKDADTNYRYEVEVINEGSNGYRIVVGSSNTDTRGYKSSEKILSGNSDRDITYNRVMLTEATPGSIREYKEYITIDKIDDQKLKSGYGYKFEPRVRFTMDTANNAARRVINRVGAETDPKAIMNLDDEIVDLSDEYINDHKNFNDTDKVAISLAIRSQNLNEGSWDRHYQLPKAYLSRKDGRIRYVNDDPSLRNVDAGNKMYVPVWIKKLTNKDEAKGPLVNYDARFESTVKLGANRISFDLKNEVDVYAFMLNHTGSPSTDLDELLLHPMDKKDDLFNWTP